MTGSGVGRASERRAQSERLPRTLRRWIVFWAAVAWLVAELASYPKDRPLSSGLGNVVTGFFSADSIAAYPAWLMLALGVAVLALAVVSRHPQKGGHTSRILFVLAALLLAWGLLATGLPGSFSLSAHAASWGWLWQTIAILLLASVVWGWGRANPERAELAVRSSRGTWSMFRRSRIGLPGLIVLVFFVLVALLAPFIVNHAWLRPTASMAPLSSRPLGRTRNGLARTSKGCPYGPK